MALNTFKPDCLTPLHFTGLRTQLSTYISFTWPVHVPPAELNPIFLTEASHTKLTEDIIREVC